MLVVRFVRTAAVFQSTCQQKVWVWVHARVCPLWMQYRSGQKGILNMSIFFVIYLCCRFRCRLTRQLMPRVGLCSLCVSRELLQ